MRLFDSITAGIRLSCGFVIAALTLSAPNSGALAQSNAAISHHQTIHQNTPDPRALRTALIRDYHHEGARLIGSELRMGLPPGATALAPGPAVADPPPTNLGCLWGLERYNGVSCP